MRVPRRRRSTTFVLIVTLAITLGVALVASLTYMLVRYEHWYAPKPVSSAFTPPVPTIPGTVVDSSNLIGAPMWEAIDLTSKPRLGTGWSPTDDATGNMEQQFFVTQCEALVTVLTSSPSHPGQGANARIVGYVISDFYSPESIEKWDVNLRQATGFSDPVLVPTPPLYSYECDMIWMVRDQNSSATTKAAVMVDVRTGQTTALASSDSLRGCDNTSWGQFACWYDDKIDLIDVDAGTVETRQISAADRAYYTHGDVVVSGLVWSPQGYRNPHDGEILFGRDFSIGTHLSDDWVVYVDPQGPDGYSSDLPVRIEGPLDSTGGTCTLTYWKSVGDKGYWDDPPSVPCGRDISLKLTVTDAALVVADERDNKVWAYSMKDGSLLWERDARLSATGWSRANASDVIDGVSDYYAVLDSTDGTSLVRLEDGVTMTRWGGQWSLLSVDYTMAYAVMARPSGQTLGAFNLGSTDPEWTLDLPGDPANTWTFAYPKSMYIVYADSGGPPQVSSLIT